MLSHPISTATYLVNTPQVKKTIHFFPIKIRLATVRATAEETLAIITAMSLVLTKTLPSLPSIG